MSTAANISLRARFLSLNRKDGLCRTKVSTSGPPLKNFAFSILSFTFFHTFQKIPIFKGLPKSLFFHCPLFLRMTLILSSEKNRNKEIRIWRVEYGNSGEMNWRTQNLTEISWECDTHQKLCKTIACPKITWRRMEFSYLRIKINTDREEVFSKTGHNAL